VSNANGTASKQGTITVSSPGGGGGHSSGGSGGGAGGSPEPQSNVEKKELSQTFIASGQAAKFDFPQKATPVVSVSFDSKKTAGKTTTIVEMLKAKSTLVSGLPSDEVYKFLNIWVGNSGFATSKNIENSVVSFKVEKSWVQDKKIDKSSITLNRYSDKTWNQLPTSLSSEDDTYLYFTAQTPGFSPFAITGKSTGTGNVQPGADKTQPVVNVTQNNANTGNTPANTQQTPQQQATSTPAKQSTSLPGFEAVFGIAGLIAVFLYKRK
jgi:PGF-pre-PGF domain-containing protein